MLKIVYKQNFDGISNKRSFKMIKENILKDNNYAVELYKDDRIVNLNIPHYPIYCKCNEFKWNEILKKIKKIKGLNMNDFQEEIKNNFDFLFDIYGFSFVEEDAFDEDFKDVIYIAQTKEVRIRFIKDRADFFLDVGSISEPEKWYRSYKILNWLKADKYITDEFKPVNKIKNVSKILRQHCKLVINFFSIENYKNTKSMIS